MLLCPRARACARDNISIYRDMLRLHKRYTDNWPVVVGDFSWIVPLQAEKVGLKVGQRYCEVPKRGKNDDFSIKNARF